MDKKQALPVVRDQLEKLAELPPGPEAKSKAQELLELIRALLSDQTITALFPAGWGVYVTAIVAAIVLVSGFLGRLTAPAPTHDPQLTGEVKQLVKELREEPKQSDPPKSKSAIKVSPPNPKGGELVVVSSDAEAPHWDFEGVFPPGSARQSGRELIVALPKTEKAATYVIRCISCDGGKILVEKVEIKADGGEQPPAPQDLAVAVGKLADSVGKLSEAVGRIEAKFSTLEQRVAALEGAKPPPPPPPPSDPIAAAIQAAYLQETDANKKEIAGKIAACYKAGSDKTASATSWGEISSAIRSKATELDITGRLPLVAKAINTQLLANGFPASPSVLLGPGDADRARVVLGKVVVGLTEVAR